MVETNRRDMVYNPIILTSLKVCVRAENYFQTKASFEITYEDHNSFGH
jgi:hypothetical protein